jgi:hypothetical protein
MQQKSPVGDTFAIDYRLLLDAIDQLESAQCRCYCSQAQQVLERLRKCYNLWEASWGFQPTVWRD